VEWGRFLRELGAEIPVLQDFAGEEAMGLAGGVTAGAGDFDSIVLPFGKPTKSY
jgi:hypothetical protein